MPGHDESDGQEENQEAIDCNSAGKALCRVLGLGSWWQVGKPENSICIVHLLRY